MSCNTLEEIVKACTNNLGGIYKMFVADQEAYEGMTVDDATWTITALLHSDPFIEVEFKRYVGNYTEEEANSDENGSTIVTQTINLPLQRREGAKSRALKIMGEGQRYLQIIVLDGNGKYWYFPYMQLTAVAEGSGTAKADGSKYAVTFVGINDQLAYEVDATVIETIKEVVS